jgi:hypothetical protein
MEQQPIHTASFSSDESGEWLKGLEERLDPGIHRVVVEDEYGNQDEAMLFVVKEEPLIMERVTRVIPESYAYASLALFAIIVALSATNIWLGRRADKPLKGSKAGVKRYLPLAIAISAVALVATLSVGVALNKRTGFFDDAKRSLAGIESPKVDVKGAVITPFSRQGVEGVDLTAGDTSIRTMAGGRYVFSAIEQAAGIKLNHPKFKVAFIKSIEGSGEMDILLDTELYNLAFDIMQLESRRNFSQIYAKLSDSAKSDIQQQAFVDNYSPLYHQSDLANQELILGKISEVQAWVSDDGKRTYPQVIQMELLNDSQSNTYSFVFENGAWALIK